MRTSLHRTSRQEHHEIKRKPQRDHDRRGDARDDDRAPWAGPYDLVDPGVLGFGRRWGILGNDHGVLTAAARSAARWLRMPKPRLHDCPRKPGCRSPPPRPRRLKAIGRTAAFREASGYLRCPADSLR